jgi:ABC-2 type transport system permease protein
MTPQSNATTQPLYWSVRRELWENRSIYIAPLAVAALTLFGFLIATLGRALSQSDLAVRRAVFEEHYTFASLVVMGTTFIVGVFYCLDALYGERRDRSILFWKSMPVSDVTTVLSKAMIPLAVLPLLTFAITVAMQLIMVLLSSAAMLASGLSPAALWERLSLSQLSLLLYHLVAVHGLYYAPIFAWLLLVSAWARRAPFLWAGLPLVVIGVVEKMAFNTSHFALMLGSRVAGGTGGASYPMPNSGAMHHEPTLLALGQFLISPGMWIGLAVAAVFLAGAVRLRRDQGPI